MMVTIDSFSLPIIVGIVKSRKIEYFVIASGARQSLTCRFSMRLLRRYTPCNDVPGLFTSSSKFNTGKIL